MTSQLFGAPAKQEKAFGHPYNGRYHMPLLPGEEGTKSGGDWVPYGLLRMTNLVGAFEDTRALNVWEQGMALIGLALDPALYAELQALILRALNEGVDFELLRNYPDLKEALAGAPHDQAKQQKSIVGRAKEVAGASAAAKRGTADHDAWEMRAKTGQLFGDGRNRGQVIRVEALLAEAGLVRVPGLSERVVRNLELGAVGKFDDVVLEQSTGRLLMADLKTKATPFYSWMTVDAQLAGYARSEWMLTEDCQGYEPGPASHVDQTEGVIFHAPSDGSPAYLRRADLVNGWEVCQVAKRNIELRTYGKSAARHAMSPWVPGNLAQAS
jgi:hypothetical protein